MRHLPALIVLFPLIAAQLCLLISKISYKVGRYTVLAALTGSLVMSYMLLRQVIAEGPVHYYFGNYKVPIGIEFSVDSVNALILLLISVIAVITMIYTTPFAKSTDSMLVGAANTMIALLTTGMLGMTATGDVFNLYVFLEITSLSAYCLISLGGSRGIVASFRYLLVGTVAATMYLVGIGILYGMTGTLNMSDMAEILSNGGNEKAMFLAMCFLIAAFGTKMALFPFHGWQPSAYTHAEAATRPLISGVMGKIPAYALFRYLYCVYGTNYPYFKVILLFLGILSVSSMLYGSIRAMAQTDIRKMLAYSSVAQIGYVVLGFAIGTPFALAGAFLHMLAHSFMKGGLFFATGAIRYKYGTTNLNDFGRMYKSMPVTSALLVIASLSMIGIPPTAGFFSKWYLALGAASQHEYIYIAVLVISSLFNAIYFFKLIEKVFIQKSKDLPDRKPLKNGKEAPMNILIPMAVCFLAILLLGIFNVKIIDILLMTTKGVAL